MPKNSTATRTKIIRAAARCLAELGFERTTFQAIADEAKISQPLVVYHLKTRPGIFAAVLDEILATSLEDTVVALASHQSGQEQLRAYIRVSLNFFRSRSEIPKLYIAFYYLSSFDPHYHQANEMLKTEATTRILEILAIGLAQGEFKTNHPRLTAKMIHVYLTGLLLNLASEKPRFSDEEFLSQLETDCLRIAGAVGPQIASE